MKVASILPSILLRSWLFVVGLVAIATCLWVFLSNHGFVADPVLWILSLVVGALFVAIGISFWSLFVLIPGLARPVWLGRQQAVALAVGCFLLQSCLAGVLTLLGAWPHPQQWFLGALPFLWSN